jgi:hypothetical protein
MHMRLIKEGGRGHFDGLRGLYSTLSVGSRLACAIGARGLFKMPPIAAQNKADSNPKGAALASSQSLSECSTRVSTLRVLMRARVGDCRPARAERSPTSSRPFSARSFSRACANSRVLRLRALFSACRGSTTIKANLVRGWHLVLHHGGPCADEGQGLSSQPGGTKAPHLSAGGISCLVFADWIRHLKARAGSSAVTCCAVMKEYGTRG